MVFLLRLRIFERRVNSQWVNQGAYILFGPERVDDPAQTERMARRLRSAWIAANGKEKVPGKNTGKKPVLTPEQEAEMRALGYV